MLTDWLAGLLQGVGALAKAAVPLSGAEAAPATAACGAMQTLAALVAHSPAARAAVLTGTAGGGDEGGGVQGAGGWSAGAGVPAAVRAFAEGLLLLEPGRRDDQAAMMMMARFAVAWLYALEARLASPRATDGGSQRDSTHH